MTDEFLKLKNLKVWLKNHEFAFYYNSRISNQIIIDFYLLNKPFQTVEQVLNSNYKEERSKFMQEKLKLFNYIKQNFDIESVHFNIETMEKNSDRICNKYR